MMSGTKIFVLTEKIYKTLVKRGMVYGVNVLLVVQRSKR